VPAVTSVVTDIPHLYGAYCFVGSAVKTPLSFPDVSFSQIHPSISVVSEQIIIYLGPRTIVFGVHSSFSGPRRKRRIWSFALLASSVKKLFSGQRHPNSLPFTSAWYWFQSEDTNSARFGHPHSLRFQYKCDGIRDGQWGFESLQGQFHNAYIGPGVRLVSFPLLSVALSACVKAAHSHSSGVEARNCEDIPTVTQMPS
jgi:hypothetical protein